MPTYTSDRERSYTYGSRNMYDSRAYSGKRLYSNTSTAYEIPMTYPERVRVPSGRPVQTPKVEPSKEKTTNYAKQGLIKVCSFVLLMVVLCCTVIYRYAVILESNQEIKALEKEYEAIMSANQVMQGKIDRYLEMGEIEKIAREELGMMKPEAYQIFYIDMEMQDMGSAGSASANQAGGALVGIPGTLVNAFRVLK